MPNSNAKLIKSTLQSLDFKEFKRERLVATPAEKN